MPFPNLGYSLAGKSLDKSIMQLSQPNENLKPVVSSPVTQNPQSYLPASKTRQNRTINKVSWPPSILGFYPRFQPKTASVNQGVDNRTNP